MTDTKTKPSVIYLWIAHVIPLFILLFLWLLVFPIVYDKFYSWNEILPSPTRLLMSIRDWLRNGEHWLYAIPSLAVLLWGDVQVYLWLKVCRTCLVMGHLLRFALPRYFHGSGLCSAPFQEW